MRDEEFVKKYEELLDKGYCNCNEMNCIDNNSSRRILNIVKRLQLEEDDLLKENRELRKKLENSFSYEEYDYQVNRNIELRKEKQELIEYLKKEQERLARECSFIYKDSLGKERLVSEDIYDEVSKVLSKIEKR